LETDTQDSLGAEATESLRRIIAAAGLSADVSTGTAEGSDLALEITGPDAGCLVGPHGHTLDALQYLLMLMVNKKRVNRVRISIDAAGYRARRIETLSKFANQLADEVVSSGQEAITDPLNAMERRIIHTALVERGDVQTYSEGDEPNRYVVVSPRVDDGKSGE
jgi:spoIIIJ-associated protein